MHILDRQPGDGGAPPWRGWEAEVPRHVNRTLTRVGHNQNVHGADFAFRFGRTGCLQGSCQVEPLPTSLAVSLPAAEHSRFLFLSPELHQEALAPTPTVPPATDSVRAPHPHPRSSGFLGGQLQVHQGMAGCSIQPTSPCFPPGWGVVAQEA